jgi:hypothetical protein
MKYKRGNDSAMECSDASYLSFDSFGRFLGTDDVGLVMLLFIHYLIQAPLELQCAIID